MSIYADACFDIALRCISECATFGRAFDRYIVSPELCGWAMRERGKFDPGHAKRFGGSRKAWDEKVWRIALDAWKDAMVTAGKPGKEMGA